MYDFNYFVLSTDSWSSTIATIMSLSSSGFSKGFLLADMLGKDGRDSND